MQTIPIMLAVIFVVGAIFLARYLEAAWITAAVFAVLLGATGYWFGVQLIVNIFGV